MGRAVAPLLLALLLPPLAEAGERACPSCGHGMARAQAAGTTHHLCRFCDAVVHTAATGRETISVRVDGVRRELPLVAGAALRFPLPDAAHPVRLPGHPVGLPAHPVELPAAPVRLPAHPVALPQHPVELPAAPVSLPAHPVTLPERALALPAAPVELPQHPVRLPEHPVRLPGHPVGLPGPAVAYGSRTVVLDPAPAVGGGVPMERPGMSAPRTFAPSANAARGWR
jgi:hypothetical protein